MPRSNHVINLASYWESCLAQGFARVTLVLCFSFMMIRDRRTTQMGMVALTAKKVKALSGQSRQPATDPGPSFCKASSRSQ